MFPTLLAHEVITHMVPANQNVCNYTALLATYCRWSASDTFCPSSGTLWCYILHKWCSACSGVHISKETEDSLPSRPPLNLTRTSLSTNLLSSLSTDAFFWGAGLLILLGTVIRIYVVRNYEKVKKHPGVTPPARILLLTSLCR